MTPWMDESGWMVKHGGWVDGGYAHQWVDMHQVHTRI